MSKKNYPSLKKQALWMTVILCFVIALGCEDNMLEPEVVDLNSSQAAAVVTELFSWTAEGLVVNFVGLMEGAQKYRWEFGDGQQSDEANPVHTYAVAGDHTVTLTVQTASGKSRGSDVVTVSEIIEPPLPPDEVPGPETNDPFAIDRGDAGVQTPGSYKGLPLRLQENGEPAVTPTNDVIGVVCIGMSNAAQECGYYISTFLPSVAQEINAQVKFVNCAVGGNAIERWIDPARDGNLWDKCLTNKLAQAGISVDQVKVIYHKAANMFTGPTPGVDVTYPFYPDLESDFYNFYDNLGAFAARVKLFFPEVQAVYTTSRSYGGFGTRLTRGEPISYEEGHALNQWLRDNPDVDGVWYGWGAYIWGPDCATGETNNSDVCYVATDYQEDGTHPGPGAHEKISSMIHQRFLEHAWYRN